MRMSVDWSWTSKSNRCLILRTNIAGLEHESGRSIVVWSVVLHSWGAMIVSLLSKPLRNSLEKA